jgi:hypothetical protein
MRVAVAVIAAVAVFASCGERGGAGSGIEPNAAASIDPITTAGSGSAVSPIGGWDWLAPFGVEVPAPSVPSGWSILEFEDFRFAVPPDWTVPLWGSCLSASPGAVFVSTPTEGMGGCVSEQPPPTALVAIGPSTAANAPGDATAVGTLSAIEVVDSACAGCSPVYRFDDNYQVSVGGPDAETVLATFTEPGTRRVLQTGEQADTTGWQSIEFDGVAFRAPPSWPVVDLPASVVEKATSSGGTQVSWIPNPDACGGDMFSNGHRATVYLGNSPPPSCPAGFFFDLRPNDGLWIRSIPDEEAQSLGSPIAHGDVDGLDVTVVRIDVGTRNRAPTAAVDLIVRKGTTTMWVSLGVGVDPTIARSVLRSLHAT